MTARAQRRDFMYMGNPGEGRRQPGNALEGDHPNRAQLRIPDLSTSTTRTRAPTHPLGPVGWTTTEIQLPLAFPREGWRQRISDVCLEMIRAVNLVIIYKALMCQVLGVSVKV